MDRTEVIRVLDETKRIIVEKGWTQEYNAVTADETHCEPEDENAVAFCVMGAASKACGMAGMRMLPGVRLALTKALSPTACSLDVFEYNDEPGRMKEDILALIDRAKDLVINGQD